MRRRLLPAGLAFLVLTGLFLVLPVFSAPRPKPVPVKTLAQEVPMGSVTAPAPAATVTSGATQPGQAAPSATPTLTVTRTHLKSFAMVGVTWAADRAVTDTVVRVRVQRPSGTWGTWTPVAAEDASPDGTPASGRKQRGGTSPLWTGPTTGVQAELTTRSGAQPADVTLDLINPGDSPADTALTAPDIRDQAHAASPMPAVYSRAQWGADESIRTWDPEYASTIKAATIHHTADSNNYTAAQVPALMRSIYWYHTVSRGWGDIGYNVIVDKFGRLWEGRYGGLASTVIGAHAGGFNTYTVGVSMLGNYDLVDTPAPMIASVEAFISWKLSLYGVNPLGTVTLTSAGGGTSKYAAGVKVSLPAIFAHRDVGSTACPGRYGYARMNEIRQSVARTYVDVTQVSQRYNSDAGLRTLLGMQTTAPTLTADGSGGVGQYQNGALYYSKATGARVVSGAIRTLWSSLGAERGTLGYPTSDVTTAADGQGSYATFQRGAIFWSLATGAQAVQSPVQALFTSLNAEHGALGYPTTSTRPTGDGVGRYQHFQNGSIFWSPTTGAQALLGPVKDLWASSGYERGRFGYPTTSVTTAADGVGQYAHFQKGSIFSTPTHGVRAVLGPIRDAWASSGYASGPLGYPTSDSAATADASGQSAQFEHGSIYWSAATGARILTGPVADRWLSDGAQQGPLGYPTTSTGVTSDGVGRYQHFQKGSIFWSPSTDARALVGPIRDLWASLGYERGALGYPTSDVTAAAVGGGRYATFQKGSIF
ncbi:MAG: hypothetical protein QOJ68_3702, partial [Blastococcus sp.]|nr:hypothetical protein [Blastococcus sp.]